jgi:hypothetical protein
VRSRKTHNLVEVGRRQVLKVVGVGLTINVSKLCESLTKKKGGGGHTILRGFQIPLYSGLSIKGAYHLPLSACSLSIHLTL